MECVAVESHRGDARGREVIGVAAMPEQNVLNAPFRVNAQFVVRDSVRGGVLHSSPTYEREGIRVWLVFVNSTSNVVFKDPPERYCRSARYAPPAAPWTTCRCFPTRPSCARSARRLSARIVPWTSTRSGGSAASVIMATPFRATTTVGLFFECRLSHTTSPRPFAPPPRRDPARRISSRGRTPSQAPAG